MGTGCKTCFSSVGILDRTLPANSRQFVIEQKALAYRVHEDNPSVHLQTKGARAIWDPNIGPSGGWRCPEGSRFGGYITDRFGRGCGGGLIRRVGRALFQGGRNLDDLSIERGALRRNRRAARRAMPGVENIPGRAQERMRQISRELTTEGEDIAPDWMPGDGGRRTRRNLQGGPRRRIPRAQRAARRQRVLAEGVSEPSRRRGSTPKKRPLRERMAIAQEKLARQVLLERSSPIRTQVSQQALRDATPPIPPKTPAPAPVPSRITTPTGKPSLVLEEMGNTEALANLRDHLWSRLRLFNRDRGLVPREYPSTISDEGKRQMDAVYDDIFKSHEQKLRLWFSVPSNEPTPPLYSLINRVHWSDISDETANYIFTSLQIVAGGNQIFLHENIFSSPLLSEDELQRLANAAYTADSIDISDPQMNLGNLSQASDARNFWSLRKSRRLRREAAKKDRERNMVASDINNFILDVDTAYKAKLDRLSDDDLLSLKLQIAQLVDLLGFGPIDKELGRRYRLVQELIDDTIKNRDALAARKREEAEKRRAENRGLFANLIDKVKGRKAVAPKVLPFLGDDMRDAWESIFPEEDYLPGELPVAKPILNDAITSVEEAIDALDAGVPLHKIPQKYWLKALYAHMDPDRSNKKQYKRLHKNGGIMKDGAQGDILILERLDEDGIPTGYGVVVGWEQRAGGWGRNGIENNAGEIIAFALMNALGLPVEPARFDGVFKEEAEDGEAGIAFVLPHLFNRAPSGYIQQDSVLPNRGDAKDGMDWGMNKARQGGWDANNFDWGLAQLATDGGIRQQFARTLFEALVGAPDRHEQNVMGGLIPDKMAAFVLPMDLGWGGNYVDVKDMLRGDRNDGFDSIEAVRGLLEDLDGPEGDALARDIAQIYDTFIGRMRSIVNNGPDAFVDSILAGLHLDVYSDSELSPRDKRYIEEYTAEAARKWYRAVSSNLEELEDGRQDLFSDMDIMDYHDQDNEIYIVPNAPKRSSVSALTANNSQSTSVVNPSDDGKLVPNQRPGAALINQVRDLENAQFDSTDFRVALKNARMRQLKAIQSGQLLQRGRNFRRNSILSRGKDVMYIIRHNDGRKFYVLNADEVRELRIIVPNFSSEFSIVHNIRDVPHPAVIDKYDPDMLRAFYNGLASPESQLEHDARIKNLLSSILERANNGVDEDKFWADVISPSDSPESASAFIKLRELLDREWDTVLASGDVERADVAINESLYKTIVYATLLKQMRDVLSDEAIERADFLNNQQPRKSLPDTNERILPDLAPVGRKPQFVRAMAPAGFVDGEIVVPQAIKNPDITTYAEAALAFLDGADLMDIPEQYWKFVLDYSIEYNRRNGLKQRFHKPKFQAGAIKAVHIYEALDSNGNKTGQGYVFVRDQDIYNNAGELLNWNLLGALGMPMRPARQAGFFEGQENIFDGAFDAFNDDEKQIGEEVFNNAVGRWIVLPHAFQAAGVGELKKPVSRQPNADLGIFDSVEGGAIVERVAGVLSQFILGLPDRHKNNTMFGVVQRSNNEQQGMVIPIDLGWAPQQINNDFSSMMQDYIDYDNIWLNSDGYPSSYGEGENWYYDAQIFEDATKWLRDGANRAEKEQEIIAIVDALIERQRAIIAKGPEIFIRNALALIPRVQGLNTNDQIQFARERDAMERKAAQMYRALVKTYENLRNGAYSNLLDMLGVDRANIRFPEGKFLNISMYRTMNSADIINVRRTKLNTNTVKAYNG